MPNHVPTNPLKNSIEPLLVQVHENLATCKNEKATFTPTCFFFSMRKFFHVSVLCYSMLVFSSVHAVRVFRLGSRFFNFKY